MLDRLQSAIARAQRALGAGRACSSPISTASSRSTIPTATAWATRLSCLRLTPAPVGGAGFRYRQPPRRRRVPDPPGGRFPNSAEGGTVAGHLVEAAGLSFAASVKVQAHSFRLSASIGIAIYPEDGKDAAAADPARRTSSMSCAKSAGVPGASSSIDDGSTDPGERPRRPSARLPLAQRAAPDFAFAEHEARLRELLEANRELVGAAQIAQKLQANAEAAHRRQINFVAMAAHALRNPLSAIRMATSLLLGSAGQRGREGQPAAELMQRQAALHRAAGRRPARRLARRHRRVPAAAARSPARRDPRRRRRCLPPRDRRQAAAAGGARRPRPSWRS